MPLTNFREIVIHAYRTGVIYSATSMAANYLIPLASLPILTRALGVSNFGIYAIAQALTIILCQVIDFGFILNGSREAATTSTRNQLSTLYSTVQNARLLIFIPIFLIVTFALLTARLPFDAYFLLTMIVPAIVGTLMQSIWLYQGISQFGTLAIVNWLSKGLYLVFIFLYVHGPSDLMLATSGYGVSYLLSGVFMLLRSKHLGLHWCILKDLSKSITLLRTSVHAFLSLALLNFHTQFIIALSGTIFSPSVAGLLAAADKIARGLAALPTPLTSALFPIITRLYKYKPCRAAQLHHELVLGIGGFCTLIVPFLFFFSQTIAHYVLPDDVERLSIYIKFTSVMPLFLMLGALYGGLRLVPMGKYKYYLYAIVWGEIGSSLFFIVGSLLRIEFTSIISLIIGEIGVAVGMIIYSTKLAQTQRRRTWHLKQRL